MTRNYKKSQQGEARDDSSSVTSTNVAMFLKCVRNRTGADIQLANTFRHSNRAVPRSKLIKSQQQRTVTDSASPHPALCCLLHNTVLILI